MGSKNFAGSLALVVPTLNEADNIGSLLDTIQHALQSTDIRYTIIVVDDSSTDGTPHVVRKHMQRDDRIQLLERSGKNGLAGAILHGWAHSDADLLGVMDADLQHPPALLPELLLGLQSGADIAIGSRYARRNGVQGWNPIRAAISRVSTLATRPLLSKKLHVTDPMSGFFIVRRSCIDGVEFQTQGFKLLLEVLVRGQIRAVHEVPYQFGLRQAGKSKASAAVAFHYLSLLGRLSREVVLRPSSQ